MRAFTFLLLSAFVGEFRTFGFEESNNHNLIGSAKEDGLGIRWEVSWETRSGARRWGSQEEL